MNCTLLHCQYSGCPLPSPSEDVMRCALPRANTRNKGLKAELVVKSGLPTPPWPGASVMAVCPSSPPPPCPGLCQSQYCHAVAHQPLSCLPLVLMREIACCCLVSPGPASPRSVGSEGKAYSPPQRKDVMTSLPGDCIVSVARADVGKVSFKVLCLCVCVAAPQPPPHPSPSFSPHSQVDASGKHIVCDHARPWPLK